MTKRPLPEDRKEECRKLKAIFNAKKRELNLTQERLAHLMGINQSSVSHYLNGVNPLNTSIGALFAHFLEVPVSDFSPRLASKIEDMATLSERKEVEWDNRKRSSTDKIEPALHPTRHFDYPEIDWSQIGTAASMDLVNTSSYPTYTSDVTAGENAFWLRVIGSSMASLNGLGFPEGMLILVAPEVEPKPGQFVIAMIVETNEATFKQLVRDAGQLYLKPLNPAYSMRPLDESWTIVGTVVDGRMPKSIFF